jgi:hypothetical protein
VTDAEPPDPDRRRWFGPTGSALGFGPLTWQGRVTLALYAFLVVVAVLLYSSLGVTLLVIAFYTVVAGSVVIATSDLRDRWPPS